MSTEVTYDRPVAATVYIHLANGETFEASPEDLHKFGYYNRRGIFSDMYQRLINLMETNELFDESHRDMSDLEIGPFYSFFSYVLNHPELLDHWENEALMVEMVNVERRLRGLEILPVPTYEEMRAKRDNQES